MRENSTIWATPFLKTDFEVYNILYLTVTTNVVSFKIISDYQNYKNEVGDLHQRDRIMPFSINDVVLIGKHLDRFWKLSLMRAVT